MPNIENALRDFNPWWKAPFHVEYKEREVYAELRKSLPLRFMLSLTGLRRVGKTTLLLKAVEDAVAAGTDPRAVAYFSFDEFPALELRALLQAIEEVTGRTLAEGRTLVLLDEVQKVAGWEAQLKVLYDRLGKHVKFLISGSESLSIRRGSLESLAGRLLELRVHPLTFREYLQFRGIPHEPVPLYRPELRRALQAFAQTMGFPELVDVKDRAIVRSFVRGSIVERVLYRDLPGLLRVRDVSVLESVLNILLDEPGQILEVSHLAGELGISRNTLSAYLTYLQKSFLLRKLYNFAPGRRKQERRLKKFYPTVLSPDLPFGADALSRARTLEWLVVTQLRAECFWRDPYKNEVDIVIPSKPPVPIEVKSGKVEVGGLLAFMEKHGVRKGYVVSSDLKETRRIRGRTIEVIPAYEFLLDPPVPIGGS